MFNEIVKQKIFIDNHKKPSVDAYVGIIDDVINGFNEDNLEIFCSNNVETKTSSK